MGDFPSQWICVRELSEGGQGHTFVIRRADESDDKRYVLKRLKNPNRADYFSREVTACLTLDHPNVLKVIEQGVTPKGKPFLITDFCEGGSLDGVELDDPAAGLRFFRQIVAGVAAAHASQPPIYHLDLKPENIFLSDGRPVVGDFGICFIEDGIVGMTSEGPRGSMYYCAPELRGPRIEGTPSKAAADVYSLGKILYWLFTKEVYDGHEEDYGNESGRHLARRFPSHPQFALVDELVSATVRRKSTDRIQNAADLGDRVQRIADRIEAGGRVLDLNIPQRCLYCAEGHYRPSYDAVSNRQHLGKPSWPDITQRRNPDDPSRRGPLQGNQPGLYEDLNKAASPHIGISKDRSLILLLVCDFCGNVQYFRLDLTSDRHGENWRP
ncbi:MAG TPA: serine/threonine-protein kinase [Bryobacteraceae bacterium]|nr:serine/threonine-protein kinase [Bryobacteraceae bacterium]